MESIKSGVLITEEFMNTKAFAECMKRNMDKQGITIEDLSKMTDISD